jgi:alkylation response protein AidB-like acyl-CoA dehydrogenase
VHFAFDEDQLAFRDQLRAFAEKECTPVQLRESWASATGWSKPRWKALADMGVVGITVPADHGGLGLGLVDLVLLLEEAGRSSLPEPILETTALAVPLLLALSGRAGDELRARWLGPVAAGDAVVAVGAVGAASVPFASAAEGGALLLVERVSERPSGGDSELHAVPAAAATLTPRRSLDGARRLAVVEWEPSPATLVASGHEAIALMTGVRDRAAMGTAAMLVGIASRLIDSAARYAVDRKQFGRPIGSFQAVKHHLANALVRVEFARPAVYRAAWSLDQADPESGLHASMAKALASDAASLAARTALQVHGAIGYTWEYDLHLWMKRAWALAAAWGDAAEQRARVLEAFVDRS